MDTKNEKKKIKTIFRTRFVSLPNSNSMPEGTYFQSKAWICLLLCDTPWYNSKFPIIPLIMFSNLFRIRNNSFHNKKTANLCILILHVLMLVVFNSSVRCTSLGLIWERALSKTQLLLLVPQTFFPQTFPLFESQISLLVHYLSVCSLKKVLSLKHLCMLCIN